MNNYAVALESYSIIEDPDLIAVEAYIYAALESDNSDVKKLKTNLNKLVKAKASGNETAVKQAKEEVDENIEDVKAAAKEEENAARKAKLKKFAKIGGIIAGTIATAATVAVVANKIKNKKVNNANAQAQSNFQAEVAKRRAEFDAKKKEMERNASELRKRIDKASAEIEANTARIRSSFDREEFERESAEIKKRVKDASARHDLFMKVGRITSGEKDVELTEEEAKEIEKLARSINKSVANLANARLSPEFIYVKN